MLGVVLEALSLEIQDEARLATSAVALDNCFADGKPKRYQPVSDIARTPARQLARRYCQLVGRE